jgi:predicted nucleic acid-binding protein
LYLADTHALVWYLTSDHRLGRKASQVFIDSENGRYPIVIPSIVLAEILSIAEKRRSPLDFLGIVRRIEQSSNYQVSDLNLEVIKRVQQVQGITEIHDRIIVATAQMFNVPILSRDKRIAALPQVTVVW